MTFLHLLVVKRELEAEAAALVEKEKASAAEVRSGWNGYVKGRRFHLLTMLIDNVGEFLCTYVCLGIQSASERSCLSLCVRCLFHLSAHWSHVD